KNLTHGDLQEAKHILKQIHRRFYISLFRSFDMTESEKNELIIKIASEHGLSEEPLDPNEIAAQLLGLISFADFEDKKKLIMPDTRLFGDRRSVLKRLKCQKRKLRKLETEQTLIGAALPDFRKI
ncbi:unnamed protein product, partial [Urochloa humidicola]